MGYLIRADHIAAEHRALKHSPRTFAVERLGIGDWPALVADERQPVISPDVWGRPGGQGRRDPGVDRDVRAGDRPQPRWEGLDYRRGGAHPCGR
ncbi:MAG: hypothetical protein WBF57_15990, partial [Mycobacterium sp.]